MTRKTIVIKKQIILFSLIVIIISIFAINKYSELSGKLDSISSENEELIEQGEDLKNQIEEIELKEQNELIRVQKENQLEINIKKTKAKKLCEFMLKNLNTNNARIDINKRLLYLDNKVMPLDNVYAFYRYMSSQSKFGNNYIEFRCLDDTHCIKYDGSGAIAFSMPVSSKYVAEKIAEDLSKL